MGSFIISVSLQCVSHWLQQLFMVEKVMFQKGTGLSAQLNSVTDNERIAPLYVRGRDTSDAPLPTLAVSANQLNFKHPVSLGKPQVRGVYNRDAIPRSHIHVLLVLVAGSVRRRNLVVASLKATFSLGGDICVHENFFSFGRD